jgi:hypothetical protein
MPEIIDLDNSKDKKDKLPGAAGRPLPDGNFSDDFKTGFRMGLRYLRQFVPA